ncbi:MAG: EEP domain-containing protein [Methylococcaceae bacterium]|nr:EEP domain-containing protein [Methylococcaceae bacterium]
MPEMAAGLPRRLRLASFNIQTGLSTSGYHEYLTGGWRHLFPSDRRIPNLHRIAQLLGGFDIVGLQEVDGGGLRSHQIVQTQYLAQHASFPYWHNQINRRIGRLALHSNGLLSRLKPAAIEDYPLPGLPGRGAILVRFGSGSSVFHLCVLHLALSRRARMRQLGFVAELLARRERVMVMGDFNCEPDSRELQMLVRTADLQDPVRELKTFPSWRPRRMLDHILVGKAWEVEHVRVLDCRYSDHLPVAMVLRPAFPAASGH